MKKEIQVITIFSFILFISINLSAQFGEAQEIDSRSCEIAHTASSDIDNDGDLDVLIVASGDKIILYKNDGKGNFSNPIFLTQSEFYFPFHISTADFDKDGDQDILAATNISTADFDKDWDQDIFAAIQLINGKIFWLINDGTGNFGEEIIIESGSLHDISTLNPIDFDKDGDMDIVSYANPTQIVLYANDGKGNFQRQLLVSTYRNGPITPSLGGAISYSTDDFDGDDKNDILYTNSSTDEISIYKNDGDGNFSNYTMVARENTDHVFSADLDNDGDQDIASFYNKVDGLKWYKNDGLVNFSDPIIFEFNIDVDPELPYNIIFKDLDNDGDIDMLGSSFSDGMNWYENDGTGNFTEQNVGPPYSVKHVADLDNDGKLDLLGANYGKLAWHKNFLGTTTSIKELLPAHQLRLFPNPFNEFLTIEQFDYSFDTAILNIFNSKGIQIESHVLKDISQQIFTYHLAHGLYFYNLVNPDGQMIANGKVIKY